MVKAMRVANCRKFLREISQCLATIMVQTVVANKPLYIADGMRAQELKFLEDSVSSLQKG